MCSLFMTDGQLQYTRLEVVGVTAATHSGTMFGARERPHSLELQLSHGQERHNGIDSKRFLIKCAKRKFIPGFN
jgi:hypothetical protein